MKTLRLAYSIGVILIHASLLSVPETNGASVQLNGPIVEDGSIWNFELSPDGNRLIYLAEQDIYSVQELYSVSAFGGPVTKLHNDFVLGDYVWDFEISPDSSRVAFSAQVNSLDRDVLYSAPIGGTSFPDQLDAPVPASFTTIQNFHFGQNSQHVVYRADHSVLGKPELYSSLNFDTPVKLNGTLVSGGVVEFFNEPYLSPDGSRALYVADQATNDVFELYSVPSTGGAATKLNGTLVSGGDVGGAAVQFSPNGSTVLYVADQATNDALELYRVPATGGTAVKVNGTLVSGGTVRDDIDNVKYSPDGSRILYVASQNTVDVFELYSASSAGGTPVKLNGAMTSGGDIDSDGLLISPDSSRVVYVADQQTDGKLELYSVPIAGGTAVKLNGPIVAGGNVSDDDDVLISPDSSRVVYLADQDTDGTEELYSAPITGGAVVKLNSPLAPGGDVEDESIKFTPDSRRVLYTADQETSGKDDLYIVLATGGTPKKINGLFAGSVDDNYVISSDGSRVYYRAATTEQFEYDGLFYHALKAQWAGGSGSWNDRNKWDQKAVPDMIAEVVISGPATVLAIGEEDVPVTDYGADILQIGGGGGTSILQLDNQSALTVTYGTTIAAGGVLRGDGYVYSDVVNTPNGEVRVAGGQSLRFDGGTFDNAGSVQVVGTAASPAEIEFSGAVTNSASTGQFAGRHAAIHFSGGLTNEGALVLSAGESDVFGDIDNTGSLVVSGGASVTFYDDIVQDGTLTISKVGSTTSAAVFLGDVSGSGTTGGGGDVFLEGDLRPGNSPGTLSFQNNVFFGAATSVDIELGGPTPGAEHDTIEIDGQLALDGELNATLIMNEGEWFFPDPDESFVIISATQGITGTFNDEQLPDPQGGLSWDIEYDADSVTLFVEGQVGDYNYDGKVSAADFTVWRDNLGSTDSSALAADGSGNRIVDEDDFQVWKDHYGEGTFGSGSGATSGSPSSAPVPEPASTMLAGLATVVLFSRGVRRKILGTCAAWLRR